MGEGLKKIFFNIYRTPSKIILKYLGRANSIKRGFDFHFDLPQHSDVLRSGSPRVLNFRPDPDPVFRIRTDFLRIQIQTIITMQIRIQIIEKC
jgi:hypothetical protein